jgi:hypothetical protein
VNSLQCPIDGVKHREEYPGGQQAYLASIPQNLYLVEVPIDSSIAMMSAKYKTLTTRLNYKATTAEIRGINVLGGESVDGTLCDDCVGEVTRITINETREKEIDYTSCQKEGVYVPNVPLGSQLIYQSSENDLEGSLFCPTGNISVEQIIGSLNEIGPSSYAVGMTIQQTGYARKPFYHDYILGVNREKGSGAKATFRIGDFSYKCDYKLENEYNNGFIGPAYCSLKIVKEDVYEFEAVFAK